MESSTTSISISIIFENPGDQGKPVDTKSSRYRPRRNHTKSRGGCLQCKHRRIKCDELRPTCSRCVEHAVTCKYASPEQRSQQTMFEEQRAGPSEDRGLSASDRVQTWALLESKDIPCRMSQQPVFKREDAMRLIEHFITANDYIWIGSPLCQCILQKHAFHLLPHSDYLIHAILGFSAAHLSVTHPLERKFEIAAIYHYHRSLEYLRERLQRRLDGDDADAIFAACILHSMMAFFHTTNGTLEKTSEYDLPTWLRSLCGSQILLQTSELKSALQKGIWSDMICLYDDSDGEAILCYEQAEVGDENMENLRAFARICGDASDGSKDVYLQPLSMLEKLALSSHDSEVEGKFVYFISTLQPAFLNLLTDGEPRALLLVAFWCAFFSRIDRWWTVQGARRECRRICDQVQRARDTRFESILAFLRGIT